jgi:hypothetical protein
VLAAAIVALYVYRADRQQSIRLRTAVVREATDRSDRYVAVCRRARTRL